MSKALIEKMRARIETLSKRKTDERDERKVVTAIVKALIECDKKLESISKKATQGYTAEFTLNVSEQVEGILHHTLNMSYEEIDVLVEEL